MPPMRFPIPGKIFLALFLSLFLTAMGNGLVVPLLPVYAHEMGASSFAVGMIFGVFSLSRMIMLPIAGGLSDTRGRKPFIVLGLLVYLLASFFYIFADSVFALLLVRFVQGGAAALIIPIVQAYVGDMALPHREGSVMSMIQVAIYGGLSAGPVLGGMVKDLHGIDAAFVMMGAVCCVGLILSLVLLPPVKTETTVYRPRNPIQFRYLILLRNRRVLGLCAFELAYIMCIGVVWSFVPLVADNRFHLPTMAIGVIITLTVLISAVLIIPMGGLTDRYSKQKLMMTGGLMAAASMLLLATLKHSWQLYCVSVLMGIGGGISAPSVMALAVIAGRESGGMASMMALLAIANSFGMIAGPVLIGWIIDSFGMPVGFMTSCILMCLGLLMASWAIFGTRGHTHRYGSG